MPAVGGGRTVTTGRLGSTGRREAYPPQLPQPGLDTVSDDFGPATSCRMMDLAAAAAGGPRDSDESAVGRLEQLADAGRSDTALRGRRLRDRRERADASVRSTGLGVAEGRTTWHVQGYCLDVFSFLP